jgi:hypothetical protein
MAASSRQHTALPGVLLGHACLGVLVGWGLLAALLIGDAGGLGSLLALSPERFVLLPAMAAQFGIGFAVFSTATALFLLRREEP